MFYLSKILPIFVLPVGVTIVCLIAGLALRRRWLIVFGTAIFWISSTPLLSGPLMRAVEEPGGHLVATEMPLADAIVVLSGGRVIAPGRAAVSEWADADRFFGGIELFHAGRAPLLVFTGGSAPWSPNAPLEGDVLVRYARELGAPGDQVVTTGKVVNTAEEATAVASLLRSRLVTRPRVLLVTSAYHMTRARRQFESNGMVVVPFPVDFSGWGSGPIGIMDFLPDAGAFGQTHVAIREIYGRLYYRLVFF